MLGASAATKPQEGRATERCAPGAVQWPWHVDIFCAISTEQNEISMCLFCRMFAKCCARARAPFETWGECELFARGAFVLRYMWQSS